MHGNYKKAFHSLLHNNIYQWSPQKTQSHRTEYLIRPTEYYLFTYSLMYCTWHFNAAFPLSSPPPSLLSNTRFLPFPSIPSPSLSHPSPPPYFLLSLLFSVFLFSYHVIHPSSDNQGLSFRFLSTFSQHNANDIICIIPSYDISVIIFYFPAGFVL